MSIINDTRKFKQYSDVLSADQAAEILDVSKKTIYKAIKSKDIHAVKVGREYKIVKSKLIEMLVVGR